MPAETTAWVLIKPDYNYLAIPADKFLELTNYMQVVSENYDSADKEHKLALVAKPMSMKLMSNDEMTVLQAKARLLKQPLAAEA